MSKSTVVSRSRVSPLGVATIEQPMDPSITYDEVTLCTDPNCPVCRAQRRDKSRKHQRHHHHKRHHHKKSKRTFWDSFLRTESAGSTVSVHSVELNERRPVYNEQVIERSVVPVDQKERRIVSTTRTKRFNDDEVVREAWTPYQSPDDEIVCCRAYDGCRCPCWCCIILIILVVILVIILIVLLATLI